MWTHELKAAVVVITVVQVGRHRQDALLLRPVGLHVGPEREIILPHVEHIQPIGQRPRLFVSAAGSCRLFLGPGFRLAARWNRLDKTVKTRKKWGKTGKKWARYGLKNVNQGS